MREHLVGRNGDNFSRAKVGQTPLRFGRPCGPNFLVVNRIETLNQPICQGGKFRYGFRFE